MKQPTAETNPFTAELRKAIQKTIAHLDSGTVGIGNDCLWQLTVREISKCPHAPLGTNAAYVARQEFDAIIAKPPFNRFVYQQ